MILMVVSAWRILQNQVEHNTRTTSREKSRLAENNVKRREEGSG